MQPWTGATNVRRASTCLLIPLHLLCSGEAIPGAANPVRCTMRKTRPPAQASSMSELHLVYKSIIEAMEISHWPEAELTIDTGINGVLSSDAALRCKTSVKQLHLLFGMHHLLPPETAYAKLDAVLDDMPRELPAQLRSAVRAHFVNVLIYGVVHRVDELEFDVDASNIALLLDEYRWPRNKKRDHMKHLLAKIVRGLAELRSSYACTASAKKEQSLSTAGEHYRKTVQRAVDKHGEQLPPKIVARIRVCAFACGRKLHQAALDTCKEEETPTAAEQDSYSSEESSSELPLPTKQLGTSQRFLLSDLAVLATPHSDTRGGNSCPEPAFKESLSADRNWTVHDGQAFACFVRTGRPAERQGSRLVAACKRLCSSWRNRSRRCSREVEIEAQRERRSRGLGHGSAAGHLRSIWLLDGVSR